MAHTLTLAIAADLLGVSGRAVTKLIRSGSLKCRWTGSGQPRFSLLDLAQIKPDLLPDNFRVISRYVRPKRLVTVPQSITKGRNMLYLRSARAALNIGAGLDLDARGALSILTDLMVIHENKGIPASPPSYIAGIIGVGQRKWTQSLEPVLVRAHKIKRVKRDGIDVYVWADDSMTSGPGAIARPAPQSTNSGARIDVPTPTPPQPVELFTDRSYRPMTDRQLRDRIIADTPAPPAPSAPMTKPTEPTEPARKPPPPSLPEAPDLIPMPTAMDVLKRAGYPTEHERGDLYWLRVEHTEALREMTRTVPINEIVARIAAAVQDGTAPKSANSMAAFETIVNTPTRRRG